LSLELAVLRKWFSAKSMTGEWLMPSGERIGYSLEDPPRTGPDNVLEAGEKIPGRTAIPGGRYRIILDWSPRFKQIMPHIVGVPLFEAIRVHVINKPEDTDGCLGIGLDRDIDWIGSSLLAYGRLCSIVCEAMMRGEQVFVTIAGDPPADYWKGVA
jgi:hypothetical protein